MCASAKGVPAGFFSRQEKITTPLYSNLFEQTCLDTGCCLFHMGGDLMETDHLHLLILHLLLHEGKHLKELVAVERRLGLGGLPLEWQHSRRMRVLCV